MGNSSWFFGALSREESTDILMNEQQIGSFLIRNSKTIIGDVVLCVRSVILSLSLSFLFFCVTNQQVNFKLT